MRSFGSDNHSGIHPQVLDAIVRSNADHARSYGDDPLTREAHERFRSIFGDDTEVHFVFNGTAANVLALDALMESHHAVICVEEAHLHVDECGAPEKWTGGKVLIAPSVQGKLTVAQAEKVAGGAGDQHHIQPRVVSIAQSTEWGTVYTAAEVRALADWAHSRGMLLHMDGARLANAAASLGLGLREASRDLGVDALSLGGTKNGLMGAEAVLLFGGIGKSRFLYRRKQAMQLASKMRFISAQWLAYLSQDLWRTTAQHANGMARKLAEELSGVSGIEILNAPVAANAIFARLPVGRVAALQKEAYFYVWRDEPATQTAVVRWMTSFDTREEEVRAFAAAIKSSTS